MTESKSSSKFLTQLEEFGVHTNFVHRNLSVEELVKISTEKNEGVLTSSGSLSVKTGKYTGRSPQDRYIIYDDETHETIDWASTSFMANGFSTRTSTPCCINEMARVACIGVGVAMVAALISNLSRNVSASVCHSQSNSSASSLALFSSTSQTIKRSMISSCLRDTQVRTWLRPQ